MAVVRLPAVSEEYSTEHERRRNATLEQEIERRWSRFEDIEVSASRIILTSPNGTRYELRVDDAGTIGTVPV